MGLLRDLTSSGRSKKVNGRMGFIVLPGPRIKAFLLMLTPFSKPIRSQVFRTSGSACSANAADYLLPNAQAAPHKRSEVMRLAGKTVAALISLPHFVVSINISNDKNLFRLRKRKEVVGTGGDANRKGVSLLLAFICCFVC